MKKESKNLLPIRNKIIRRQTMAITDSGGNKLPQPRMGKRELSAKFRDIASDSPRADQGLGSHCSKCGYRIRNVSHDAGAHHKGTVPLCRR